ncbi:hypothetical protein NK6_223 [Bradyrhizobium diazoefficiens]|uniref:Uncharacterized protein n=1 Tax=Bradyrhizobium diazoefficiens TaxID=1355477 RepID=A0A0E4BJL8_9BRAD|nr:hypothetical protein NK6_223 [Bradyrhizobium diazoefficiens]
MVMTWGHGWMVGPFRKRELTFVPIGRRPIGAVVRSGSA